MAKEKQNHYEALCRPVVLGMLRKTPLTSPLQELADKNFVLLKENPKHPSLHIKKTGRYWSVRVGIRHRALAVEVKEGLLWFWIGTHAEYDKLLQ